MRTHVVPKKVYRVNGLKIYFSTPYKRWMVTNPERGEILEGFRLLETAKRFARNHTVRKQRG